MDNWLDFLTDLEIEVLRIQLRTALCQQDGEGVDTIQLAVLLAEVDQYIQEYC